MDVYSPFLRWFRVARLRLFYAAFQVRSTTRVVDLGGGPHLWQLAGNVGLTLPQVTVVNTRPPEEALPGSVKWVMANACTTPFRDGSFDIVFSNSLIEHLPILGRAKFAAEVNRLGSGYFIQTPDKHFPIEPHFLTPFIHWFPKIVQRNLARCFTTWGLLTRPSRKLSDEVVNEIELLGKSEMRNLFPDAELVGEKVAGMTKSIVLIHRN